MIDIDEYRGRQVRQPDSPSVLVTIASAVVAFAISACTVLYWDKIPAPAQWMPQLTGSAEPDHMSFAGDRIGRSETAPLLKICLSNDLIGADPGQNIEPGTRLHILEAANKAGHVPVAFGAKPQHGQFDLAAKWGAIADCVYRANSSQLCDINNRALAVQAANAFTAQADKVISKSASYSEAEVSSLAQVRDRVLESLQDRVKNGVLIAKDFSTFAPAAVRLALSKAKTVQNACAGQQQ